MKIPKWQTDPVWALRRAKKRNEKLPEEVEKLFLGKPDYCLSYFKDTIKLLGESKLPDFLVDSVFDHYKAEFISTLNNPLRLNVAKKSAASWVVSYVAFGGQMNEKINCLFTEAISQNLSNHYDWGRVKALKLAELLGYNLTKDLEDLLWKYCAIDYSVKSKKRIPLEIELKKLSEADEDSFIEYVHSIFEERAPENIELLLVERPVAACSYAKNIIKGKLPEIIHSSLIMHTFGDSDETTKESIVDYLNFIEKIKIYAIRILEDFDVNTSVGDVLKIIKK